MNVERLNRVADAALAAVLTGGFLTLAVLLSGSRWDRRINVLETRVQELERNWKLDDALLERAETVIGRIERRLTATTNVVVTQDAQGGRTVLWTTNPAPPPKPATWTAPSATNRAKLP